MLSFTEMAVTSQEAEAYAESRGLTWADDEGALRRGQDYIAATYNSRWKDEWANEEAPEGVKFAIIEAAFREAAAPNSLLPDMKRGGKIKAVGAGSARVEFMDGAPAGTSFTKIDRLLNGLVKPASSFATSFVSRA